MELLYLSKFIDFRKIKEIYKVFEPVTFVQLAAQSMLIILQAYMIFIVNTSKNII